MSLAADTVKRFEGCRLHAYPDPATGAAPYTIGWGHTGQGIGPHTMWLQGQADAQLEHDLAAFGDVIRSLVNVPLTEYQFAALVSFSYNQGSHRLVDPRCKILPLLNAGDYLSAAGQFLHWTVANGIVGFLRPRRIAELELFLSEVVS